MQNPIPMNKVLRNLLIRIDNDLTINLSVIDFFPAHYLNAFIIFFLRPLSYLSSEH